MKEIYIERQKELLRIAIKNNEKLEECFIEEESAEPMPGQIYKGTVKNIVPAIKCAFVDIGCRKNGYMYLDSKFNNTRVKKGDEIIVEIVKEEMGGKGAKVTNAISVPGRYVVLVTLDNNITFSKKIENDEFKKKAMEALIKPKDIGVMVRTNAENVALEQLNEEIESLYLTYKEIQRQGQYALKPRLLMSDEGILDKILRDNLDGETKKVFLNEKEDFQYVKNFIENKSDIDVQVQLHEDNRTLFDSYGIEKEILTLRNNRVQLSCGGNVVIEKTEAMYVIDVNSGKNVKNSSIEKTALSTNLQAAEEIGRQIRLRNLNGIIVIDFIDMEDKKSKKAVYDKLQEGFKSDKNKTVIYPFTELNLVQIARRRRGKTIYEYIEENCSECKGKGKRLKLSYIKSLIRNELARINKEQDIKDIYIEIDESYKEEITGNIIEFVGYIEALEKEVYMSFTNNGEIFKVEPLLFTNQIRNLQMFKIYG